MSKNRIETFLDDISDHRSDLFPIAIRLREIILASGPAITEEIKYGGLLFSSRTAFCGVFPYTAHVTLEFSEGAALPDPYDVLAGNGKHRRHIKLLTVADIEGKRVETYVGMARQAAESRSKEPRNDLWAMAEEVGFEPTVRSPARRFSRPVP